jgi:hypothetical protein
MRFEARFRAVAVRYASVGIDSGTAESTDGHGLRGGSGVLTVRRSGLLTVLPGVWLLTWLVRLSARWLRWSWN